MKSIYLATIILLIQFYCSCCKEDPRFHRNPPAYDQVTIAGINSSNSRLAVNLNDSVNTPITVCVSLMSSDPSNDLVSCTLSGAPAGITMSLDTGARTLPAIFYGSIITSCDTGNYNVMLTVNSRNKGPKQYPVTLHVAPVPDGAPGLIGTYAGSDPCGHFSTGDVWYNYTAAVTTLPGRPHWISIKNYRGLGDSIIVYASIQGIDQGSVNIPLQTIHGYTIYGNGEGYYGTQENGKPWISVYGDTIVHAGDTQTCITQLNVQ